ncbi:hypothetical protein NIES2134_112410 [Thermostichus vulcanus NIES-2134]|nr:hypothetical protein NIES2134_112410 [Thermostichus vulcanus NIES-2134]
MSFRSIKFSLVLAGTLPALAPVLGQTEPTPRENFNPFGVDHPVLQRARNWARQAAERANGRLSRYRAEASLFGPASQSPYVDNGDGTFTFRFLGGPPAAPPAIERIVTVNPDPSNPMIRIDYNGPIQSVTPPQPLPGGIPPPSNMGSV